MKQIFRWAQIAITQQVIYWIMNIFNHYRLTAIDLSRQIELKSLDLKQQINFIGKLEEDNRAAMFFITEKSEETIFNFPQNAVSIIKNGDTKNHKLVK